jgi:hypothetical protein
MTDARTFGAAGFARRLGSTVRKSLGRQDQPQEAAPADGSARPPRRARERQEQLNAELAQVRAQARAAEQELEQLTTERDRLREERLGVQQELGALHGMRVMPRLKVEKTNGDPSFVVGQRMMQRIYRRAPDAVAGLDGVGAVLADPAGTARFVRSHGIPVVDQAEQSPDEDGRVVVVHAFKGEVGLVEVRGPQGARHLTADGKDPGDIRPAVPHDPGLEVPERLSDICAWSQVLSAHVPRPYVQIVWAEEPPRVQRLEVDPDRIPVLTQEWDRRLGALFDGAYARFLLPAFRAGGLDNRVPGGTFRYEEGA